MPITTHYNVINRLLLSTSVYVPSSNIYPQIKQRAPINLYDSFCYKMSIYTNSQYIPNQSHSTTYWRSS